MSEKHGPSFGDPDFPMTRDPRMAKLEAEVDSLRAQVAVLRKALEAAKRDFCELRQSSDLADCIGFAATRIDAALSATPADCERQIRADQKQRGIEAVKALAPCPEHLDTDRLRGYGQAIRDAAAAIERAEVERG